MGTTYQPLSTSAVSRHRNRLQSHLIPFILLLVGIVLGVFLSHQCNFRPNPKPRPQGCSPPLPVDLFHHRPLPKDDRRFAAAGKELAHRLEGNFNETDSAVLLVLHGGEVVVEWSYGRIRSNLSAEEDDRKVDANTIWRVASITKVFTVLEALVQQSKGTLSLDDDVRKYVEGFKLYNGSDDKVALRSLGSHLSGLGRDILTSDVTKFPSPDHSIAAQDIEELAPAYCDPGTSDRSNGTRICSKEDILKAIASRPLAFQPWTRPLYSNTGFNLLGWATAQAAIQSQQDKTSEITLETLLQEDVFDPLDMKDTTFLVPPEKKANVSVARKGVPMMIDWDFTSTFNPAGGMYTTANDLAKFVNGVLLAMHPSILSSQQVREWLLPLYVFMDRKTGVGMPWEITLPTDEIAQPLYAKAGSHPGHTSELIVSPHLAFAVIAFACGPHPNARSLAFEAERVITPVLQQALGERGMEEYVGIYRLNCSDKRCNGCGEISVEVDSEIKITRFIDCEGNDGFKKFDAKCDTEECIAKLWPVGRHGEFRAKILSREETDCESVWFGFEPFVINGWPMDLIKLMDGKLIYEPLGIDAKRVPIDPKCRKMKGKERLGMLEAPIWNGNIFPWRE